MTVNAPPPSNPLPAVSVIVASFAPPPAADELIKNPSLLEFIVTFEPGNKEPLNTPSPNLDKNVPLSCDEPETIRFEWFLSGDQKSATLIEMFADSDAAKLRLDHHSESHLIQEFPEHFEIKNFIVLGNIKKDMREKLEGWNADQRAYVGGFFKQVLP